MNSVRSLAVADIYFAPFQFINSNIVAKRNKLDNITTSLAHLSYSFGLMLVG
jgi:hypothetical protein